MLATAIDWQYDLFTGNDSGALLLDYLLSERQKRCLYAKIARFIPHCYLKLGVDVAKTIVLTLSCS